jgi:HSP20 family molecular chaperone IbpA
MKVLMSITFVFCLLASANSYSWSFAFDDMQWSESTGSGSGYRSGDYQSSHNIRMIKDQDYANYYLYIELQGLTAEEVDIQRQGMGISIRQVRGRMEEQESRDYYRSWQSYSSFSRRLTLPPDADPDSSKMTRENHENYIRLTIPKRPLQLRRSGY